MSDNSAAIVSEVLPSLSHQEAGPLRHLPNGPVEGEGVAGAAEAFVEGIESAEVVNWDDRSLVTGEKLLSPPQVATAGKR